MARPASASWTDTPTPPMAPRANVRLLTIRSANSCKQEGQPFRLPQPHPADALTSSITAGTRAAVTASQSRSATSFEPETLGASAPRASPTCYRLGPVLLLTEAAVGGLD